MATPTKGDIERKLARNDTWRTFLTPVSIVLSALGIFLGLWQENSSRREDAQRQAAAQARQERFAFQLEASRIVMAQPTCKESLHRAAVFRVLFPGQIPADFAAPIQIALGKYRFNPETRKFEPRPDSTGCTGSEPIPATPSFTRAFNDLFGDASP